ncbi:YncE family protein, partial [Rhodococcus erythropolis]
MTEKYMSTWSMTGPRAPAGSPAVLVGAATRRTEHRALARTLTARRWGRAAVTVGGLCALVAGLAPAAQADTVIATVPVGSTPEGVAITPDGNHAYVTNAGDGTVSVISTATNTVTAAVPVGSTPRGVAITPDGTRVYVTTGGARDGTVSVISTATNTVTAAVPVGGTPFGVAVAPDGMHAYVTNLVGDSVSVIETATNTTATVPVGVGPRGVAITPDGTHTYVTNSGDGTVSV